MKGRLCRGWHQTALIFTLTPVVFGEVTSRSLIAARPPAVSERWRREIWAHRAPPCQHQREAEEAEGPVRLSCGFSLSQLQKGSDREDTAFSSHCLQGLSSALVFHCLALCSIDLTSVRKVEDAHIVSVLLWNSNSSCFIHFGDIDIYIFFCWWIVICLTPIHRTRAKLCSGDYVTVMAQDEHVRSSCFSARSKLNVNHLLN